MLYAYAVIFDVTKNFEKALGKFRRRKTEKGTRNLKIKLYYLNLVQ